MREVGQHQGAYALYSTFIGYSLVKGSHQSPSSVPCIFGLFLPLCIGPIPENLHLQAMSICMLHKSMRLANERNHCHKLRNSLEHVVFYSSHGAGWKALVMQGTPIVLDNGSGSIKVLRKGQTFHHFPRSPGPTHGPHGLYWSQAGFAGECEPRVLTLVSKRAVCLFHKIWSIIKT